MITTEKFDFTPWMGTDMDLETSLFGYGFIAKQPTDRTYADEWFILYDCGHRDNRERPLFDTGWLQESFLNNLINGGEWMDEEDVKSLLESVGCDKQEWLQLPFVTKLSDLVGHWGIENYLGSSYDPFSKTQAKK